MEVQTKIINHNRLDQQLFDFAKELFEEVLREQPSDFWVELDEFKNQQVKLFEEEGECEDDAVQFGGWSCNDEKRSSRIQDRFQKRQEGSADEELGSKEERALRELVVLLLKQRRYW